MRPDFPKNPERGWIYPGFNSSGSRSTSMDAEYVYNGTYWISAKARFFLITYTLNTCVKHGSMRFSCHGFPSEKQLREKIGLIWGPVIISIYEFPGAEEFMSFAGDEPALELSYPGEHD